jgi:hypothetical protein
MEEILIRLSSQQGVTGCFFVGDDNSFVSQTLSQSFVKENAQRAVVVLSQTFDALNQVAQFQITKMMVNSRGIRLFIRRTEKGYLNLLTDATADVAVIDAPAPAAAARPGPVSTPAAPAAQPKPTPVTAAPVPAVVPAAAPKPVPAPAPAAPPPAAPPKAAPVTAAPALPKPAPVPAAPLEPAVLDKILAVAEEFLGELGPDIFQNQMTDHKVNKDKLLRDPVMKFCYGMQKDAAMIIGPSAAKQMADKMMLLLK